MVSFRYHVVSLAGVFLALATGIVLGSATLVPATTNPPAPTTVPTTSASADEFVRTVAPRLVKGALSGRKVVVLLAPDAPSAAQNELLAMLRVAGASVTGQVRLRAELFDPGSSAALDQVASGVLPNGLTLPATTPLDRVATELAATLVSSTRGSDGSASDRSRVVGALTAANLLTTEGSLPTSAADLVVLLAGPARGAALTTVTTAFSQRVGTVVAAPLSATRGSGVLAALRGQTGLASDVDGVDTPQGLVTVILALAEQVGGRSGHYGSGAGARATVPTLP
ncbi:MAG: hypothetical protein JWM02_2461 [Frankiales bacterium]|nr:hypothetical protein [Frankiales bacterium]